MKRENQGTTLEFSVQDVATTSDPEEQALEALGRKDFDSALEILMDNYGTPVFRYCLKMLRNRETAQDVLQTTFVNAYRSFKSFSARSSLRTWLFGIAHHRCLDEIRTSRRRRDRFDVVDDLPVRAAPDQSVEGLLVEQAYRTALNDCLHELASGSRSAVLLRFSEELKYPEIARILKVGAATCQARVTRALPQLRRCLETKGIQL